MKALKEVVRLEPDEVQAVMQLAKRDSDGHVFYKELLTFFKRRATALKGIHDRSGGKLLNKLRALKNY